MGGCFAGGAGIKKGPGHKAPARVAGRATARTRARGSLEDVTQGELHDAPGARLADGRLRAGVAPEVRRRIAGLRVEVEAERRDRAEALRVGHVEDLGAERQLVVL